MLERYLSVGSGSDFACKLSLSLTLSHQLQWPPAVEDVGKILASRFLSKQVQTLCHCYIHSGDNIFFNTCGRLGAYLKEMIGTKHIGLLHCNRLYQFWWTRLILKGTSKKVNITITSSLAFNNMKIKVAFWQVFVQIGLGSTWLILYFQWLAVFWRR